MIKFLAKRVIGTAFILSVIAFFVDGYRIEVPIGLLTGSLLSMYKMKLTSMALKALSTGQGSAIKCTLLIIAMQLFILLTLLAAALVDVHFFFGVFIGMLILMAFICINSITEKIGITHNEWGDF